MTTAPCPLCSETNERLLWRDERLRVIDASDDLYPGFTRVIWQAHVAEMTDLSPSERQHLMRIVWTVEQAQRDVLAPDKINLASLGNVVPHLHWHVIPRWRDDRHYPDAIWATVPVGKDIATARTRAERVREKLSAYHRVLVQALAQHTEKHQGAALPTP